MAMSLNGGAQVALKPLTLKRQRSQDDLESLSIKEAQKKPCPIGLKLDVNQSLIEMVRNELTTGRHNSPSKNPLHMKTMTEKLVKENHEVPIREESLEPGISGDDGMIKSNSLSLQTSEVPEDDLPERIATSSHKMKASNCPAISMRIGNWKVESRYEGDLLAKAYYAKRKLVWEILEKGVKSKIEVPWSEICAFKIEAPDGEIGCIKLRVSKPPLFYKEDEPQPRKHTVWLQTPDFTNGEASRCKQHTLFFPAGVLNKHYKKLIDCDPRLRQLALYGEKDTLTMDIDSTSVGSDSEITIPIVAAGDLPAGNQMLITKPDTDSNDMVVPDVVSDFMDTDRRFGGVTLRTHISANDFSANSSDSERDIWSSYDKSVPDPVADALVSMFLKEPIEQ